MKTLLKDLKRAFDAVEFTNVSHLNALNAKLNHPQQSAAEFKIERHNAVSRCDAHSVKEQDVINSLPFKGRVGVGMGSMRRNNPSPS